jgi:hypothetical protein
MLSCHCDWPRGLPNQQLTPSWLCVTQRMMIEQEVKVTPTFLLYRDQHVVHRLSGINEQNLRTAIEEN